MTQTKNYRRSAGVATLVLAGGVLASLAGNLQAINLDNQTPGVGAYVSAVLWPLWLFGTVELLIHTPWLSNWRDRLTKGAVVILVAGVAAWVSYWHLANVLSHYGYDVASRYAGPLAIDAAMVLAALALDRVGQARRAVRPVDMAIPMTLDNSEGQMDIPLDTRPAPSAADLAELDKMTDGVSDAIEKAGQEMASEASGYLASIVAGGSTETTTPPVPVVRPSTPRGKITDVAAALAMALEARGNGMNASEVEQVLAAEYGVSTRTARRFLAAQQDAAETESSD